MMRSATTHHASERFTRLRNRQRLRTQKGCRRALSCLTLVLILLFLLGCALLTWGVLVVRDASASEPTYHDIVLVIDHSNSVFDRTDPNGLRLAAARLFIALLGSDETGALWRVGIVTFGTRPTLVAPLTRLVDDTARTELAHRLIAAAEPEGWTDPVAALELAHAMLGNSQAAHRAVLLLTDGDIDLEPGNDIGSTDAETPLQNRVAALAQDEITLNVILLSGSEADVRQWSAFTATTPAGRLYNARVAGDLPDIYHDAALQLSHRHTLGPVIQATVGAGGIQRTLEIPDHWHAMTLVVARTDADQQVTVTRPNGDFVLPTDADIRITHGADLAHIWSLTEPESGFWTVRIDGPGPVQVWLDYQADDPTPTPVPTDTPTATATKAAARASATRTSTRLFLPPPEAQTPIVTLTATKTPTPYVAAVQPTTTTWEDEAQGRSAPPSRLWMVPALLVLAVVGGVLVRHSRRRSPVVYGALRILGGDVTTAPHIIDLEHLHRRSVTVGNAAIADIALPKTDAWVTFNVGPLIGRLHTITVNAADDDAVLLDDLPLQFATQINDGMILTLPPYRLQYENLRLRQALRLQPDSPKTSTLPGEPHHELRSPTDA